MFPLLERKYDGFTYFWTFTWEAYRRQHRFLEPLCARCDSAKATFVACGIVLAGRLQWVSHEMFSNNDEGRKTEKPADLEPPVVRRYDLRQ